MTTPIGLSTWTDFGGPFGSPAPPCVRIHLANCGDGVLVDEDSGIRYPLGLPDGLDQAFMQATGLVNDHTVDCFRYQQLRARA